MLESLAGYHEAHLVLDICQLFLRQELLGGDVLVPRPLVGSVDVLFDFFDIVEVCWVGVYPGFYFSGGAEDNACRCQQKSLYTEGEGIVELFKRLLLGMIVVLDVWFG